MQTKKKWKGEAAEHVFTDTPHPPHPQTLISDHHSNVPPSPTSKNSYRWRYSHYITYQEYTTSIKNDYSDSKFLL